MEFYGRITIIYVELFYRNSFLANMIGGNIIKQHNDFIYFKKLVEEGWVQSSGLEHAGRYEVTLRKPCTNENNNFIFKDKYIEKARELLGFTL